MYQSNNCAKNATKSYMCIQDKGNRFLKTMFGEALARTRKKRDKIFKKSSVINICILRNRSQLSLQSILNHMIVKLLPLQ